MAKLSNAKVKETSGGYFRLFGVRELGSLMSKVHSTVISSGSELEHMILGRVQQIDDLDTFLSKEIMPDGVFVATKKQIKSCSTLSYGGSEPDLLIFRRRQGQQRCHVIELKDGHVFDTKKAKAESEAVHGFIHHNAMNIPYVVSGHFCAFNQDDPEIIWKGFKKRISREEAMTGREFCELLEINYEEILEARRHDQEENVKYFLDALLRINEIREQINTLKTAQKITGVN